MLDYIKCVYMLGVANNNAKQQQPRGCYKGCSQVKWKQLAMQIYDIGLWQSINYAKHKAS